MTQAASAKLPIMLEAFMSRTVDGKVVNDLSTEAVINSVAIASALGASSAYSWLKLPVVDGMERVMAATTLPTLLLGGDSGERPGPALFVFAIRATATRGARSRRRSQPALPRR